MTPTVFKQARLNMKLTQSELASRLDMTKRMIQKIESGENKIRKVHELSLRWIALDEFHLTIPYEYQDEMVLEEPDESEVPKQESRGRHLSEYNVFRKTELNWLIEQDVLTIDDLKNFDLSYTPQRIKDTIARSNILSLGD